MVGLATLEGRSINLALPIEYVKPYLKPSSPKTLTALRKEDQNSPEALYYKGNFALYALGDSEKPLSILSNRYQRTPPLFLHGTTLRWLIVVWGKLIGLLRNTRK